MAEHGHYESLLAAYALHAVEPEDVVELQEHLPSCPRCRSELNGYLGAAPLLGNAAGEPPPDLWQDVLHSIGSQPAGSVTPMSRRLRRAIGPSRRWHIGPRPFAAAAAVVVVLGVAVGTLAVRVADQPGSSAADRLREASAAAMAGPHTTVELRTPSHVAVAEIVVTSGAQGYLVASSLRRLAPSRTYQLWASVDGTPVSLGTLGRAPRLSAFRVDPATNALMVTAEPDGGVVSPDGPVLAQGAYVPTRT